MLKLLARCGIDREKWQTLSLSLHLYLSFPFCLCLCIFCQTDHLYLSSRPDVASIGRSGRARQAVRSSAPQSDHLALLARPSLLCFYLSLWLTLVCVCVGVFQQLFLKPFLLKPDLSSLELCRAATDLGQLTGSFQPPAAGPACWQVVSSVAPPPPTTTESHIRPTS